MDLFKAIFENSASSSSSEASDDDEDRQQMDAESRTATTDNVKADTVPYVTAAAVPEAALMTVQQQDYKGRAYLTPYRSVGGLLFSLPETTDHWIYRRVCDAWPFTKCDARSMVTFLFPCVPKNIHLFTFE